MLELHVFHIDFEILIVYVCIYGSTGDQCGTSSCDVSSWAIFKDFTGFCVKREYRGIKVCGFEYLRNVCRNVKDRCIFFYSWHTRWTRTRVECPWERGRKKENREKATVIESPRERGKGRGSESSSSQKGFTSPVQLRVRATERRKIQYRSYGTYQVACGQCRVSSSVLFFQPASPHTLLLYLSLSFSLPCS